MPLTLGAGDDGLSHWAKGGGGRAEGRRPCHRGGSPGRGGVPALSWRFRRGRRGPRLPVVRRVAGGATAVVAPTDSTFTAPTASHHGLHKASHSPIQDQEIGPNRDPELGGMGGAR